MNINYKDLIGLPLSGKSIIEYLFNGNLLISEPDRNKVRNLEVNIEGKDKVRGDEIITGCTRKSNMSYFSVARYRQSYGKYQILEILFINPLITIRTKGILIRNFGYLCKDRRGENVVLMPL